MANLATIGYSVNTQGLTAGTTALQTFAGANQQAKGAQQQLAQGSQVATTATQAYAQQLGKTASAHAGMSSQAMSAQHSVRSFLEQVMLGQSPMTALIGQANHLSFAASGPGGISGAFKEAAGMITKFLTPTTLAVAGVAAFGAAAIGAVQYTVTWMKALDDLSRTAGASADSMYKLQQLAGFKGINADEFAAAMTKFSDKVYLAKSGLGDLGELLRANGIRANDFDSSFEGVATLIKRSTTDMEKLQLLQRAGLPATMDFARLMSMGADGIREAKAQLQGVPPKFDEMVAKARAFDEMWNTAWTNFATYSKGAIATAIGYMAELKEAMPFSAGDVWEAMKRMLAATAPGMAVTFWSAIAAGGDKVIADIKLGAARPGQEYTGVKTDIKLGNARSAGNVDPTVAKGIIGQYSAYIGALGELATVDEKVKAKSNELYAAFLAGGGVTKELAAQIRELTRIKAEEQRQQEGVTFGVYDDVKAKGLVEAAIASEKARRDTLIKTLDDERRMRQALTDKAKEQKTAALAAGSGLPELTRFYREAQDQMKQFDKFGVQSLQNFENALVDVATGTKKLGDAFKTMVDAIMKDLARLLIRQSITGPLAQSITGLFKGVTPSANGNVFSSAGLTAFAQGGIVSSPTIFPFANGVGLMGEAGEEAIMPLRRGPGGRLGVEVNGGGGGASQQPIVEVHNYGGQRVSAQPGGMKDGRQLIRITVGAVKEAIARGEFRDVGLGVPTGKQ